MPNNKTLLKEGGVAGHMMHLYENPDITFKEIKQIFYEAASGRLVGTEKTDGQNLFVSYSVREGVAKAARNKGNIKSGGLNAEELAKKFEDRGNLTATFTESFQAFEEAMKLLDQATLIRIFGPDAEVFYNAEIMDIRSSNVIRYDTKSLVFHQVGHAAFDKKTGNVIDIDVGENVRTLNNALETIQKQGQAASGEYQVKMNAVRHLKAMDDAKPYKDAVTRLDNEISRAHISDDATLADYLISRLVPEINKRFHNASKEAKQALLKRLLGVEGINSNMVFSLLSIEQKQLARDMIREQPTLLKHAIAPIEEIVHDFSVEALKGLQSAFILDNQKEVQRLRDEVGMAIAAIKNSKNKDAMGILKAQLKKLKDIENIHTAAEGFVFTHNGQTYKLTGNFAPINQLLGLFKYGRGNIPAMIKEEGAMDVPDDSFRIGGTKRIALVPGAFKPPHKGHLEMVKQYAEHVDKVIIFMSPLSRKMPDGKEMTYSIAKSIWITYLRAENLIEKVEVLESPVNSPVGASFLFVANEQDNPEWAQPGDTVLLGVSTKGGDQERFEKAQKYAREGVSIISGEESAVQPIMVGGVELSASDMRKAISENDLAVFSRFIPNSLKQHSETILRNIHKRLSDQAAALMKERLVRFVDRTLLEQTMKISNSLGIPRDSLPQIKDMDDFRKYLNRRSRTIKYTEKKMLPKDIKPVQEEYNPKKVQKFEQWLLNNVDAPKKPVVISKDQYIIDGHHRWLAGLSTPKVPIEVLIIGLPFAEVLKLSKQYVAMLAEAKLSKDKEYKLVKPLGKIGTKPIPLTLEDTELWLTDHAEERRQFRKGIPVNIPEAEVRKAVDKILPTVLSDLINGDIRPDQEILIRASRKNKLDLNIVIGLHMKPGADTWNVITVMEKFFFTPKDADTIEYDVRLY